MEAFARVLSARDVDDDVVLDEDHLELSLIAGRESADGDRDAERIGLSASARAHRHTRGGRSRGVACEPSKGSVIAPDAVAAALNHGLGRVKVPTVARIVLSLPVRPAGGGERVGPAEVVPVVDVKADREDAYAGDRLVVLEARELVFRRRAGRAPLGGEELHEDGDRGLRRLHEGLVGAGDVSAGDGDSCEGEEQDGRQADPHPPTTYAAAGGFGLALLVDMRGVEWYWRGRVFGASRSLDRPYEKP
jgi:hypothetical protein